MKISNIRSEESRARRLCTNGRCAEPATHLITIRLGEDEGIETGNGPQTATMYACNKHKIWFLGQYAKEA